MFQARVPRGTVFAGDYKVLDEAPLSEGGMGAIYVVEQISTGKRRALKVMHAPLLADEKLRERFVQEARIGGKIESAHVVDVVSAGIDEATGMPWLAMELLEGGDLAKRIDQGGPLRPAEALEVFEQLCHAVGAAHAAGIVHRDLKPENIFLARSKEASARSVVKVLDFGLAKIIAEAVTKRTGAMGTPLWMAPEQTEAGVVDATADVWALGLIVFYTLCGRCFWKTGNLEEVSIPQIMRESLFDPLPLASTRAAELGCAQLLPPGFDAWFARCVVRDRTGRFPNATAAFDGLRMVLRPSRGSITELAMPVPAAAYHTPPPAPPLVRPEEIDRTDPAPAPIHAPTVQPPTMLSNELPARAPSRSPLLFVLSMVGLVVFGGAALLFLRASGAAPGEEAERSTGSAEAPSASAVPSPAPGVASSAPLAANDAPFLPRPETSRGMTDVVPVPPEMAFLTLSCAPPARVLVDKKFVGMTPRVKLPVTPGPHTITFINKDEGLQRTIKVTLRPGETKPIAVSLRERADE